MTSLAAWEQAQQSQLDRLKADGAGGGMVLQLLQTSCLLELAKLNTTDMDLRSFAAMVVDVLGQFLPVGGVLVKIRPGGMGEVRAGFDESTTTTASGYPIVLHGDVSGELVVDGVPDFLADSAFFQKVADQLAATLASVVQGEQLQRKAAVAEATRLAIELDGSANEESFQALIAAMLELPGVTGGAMAVRGPSFPAGIRARAGERVGATSCHDRILDTRDHLTAEVWWRAEPPHEDVELVDQIVRAAGTSIERAGRNLKLIAEAEMDPLTGIGNRRRAGKALTAALNLAGRQGETVAILALDLDHFKEVNDTLGHAVGDAVLQSFAAMLERQRRAYDTVARMGGEEFLVICPVTNGAGAKAFAERLRLATPAACTDVLPIGWRQTVSIGIALYPYTAEDADALLLRADEALYEAKRAGRDAIATAAARLTA